MIQCYYTASDGYITNAKFDNIKDASTWCRDWIGDHPDIGRHYAVSFDGIGTIHVQGALLDDIFPG